MRYRVTVRWVSREDYIVTADSSAEALANWPDGTLTYSVEEGPTADVYRLPEGAELGEAS